MRVWGYPDRRSLLISTGDSIDTVEWPSGSVPTEVYVEASSYASFFIDSRYLLLYYTGVDCNTIPPTKYIVDRVPQAEIYFTFVEVDMDMDGVKDDYYREGPVTEETRPGGFIVLNDDDDNNNETPDKDEGGVVAGEDDLVKIILRKVVPTDIQGVVTLNAIAGGSKIKVWESATKGTLVTLPKIYATPTELPKELWVEGVETSSTARDITLALQCGGFDDRIRATVFDVDLLVNNTTAQTDDYVVMQKSADEREIPKNWPVGAPDNHIPMKVHLEGPSGFSCKVKLTTNSGGGEIIIKKTDGSQYPAEGESVTVGTDLLVRIFGTLPSTDLDDVIITVKTDKTNDRICAQEDLTVIYVYSFKMLFRGSPYQGEALTACSTAKFTDFQPWRQDQVGKFIYHKPTGGNFDVASYQMEFNILPTPHKVISDVEWDIKREASAAYWGPGTDPRPRTVFKGETDWADDDSANADEDLTQCPDCKKIFVIDCPGWGDSNGGLSYTMGYKYSEKNKFREWVEVKIGNDWFVCSQYREWRSIMHVKFEDAATGWIEDTSKTNEIVVGTISGFAGSWSEN